MNTKNLLSLIVIAAISFSSCNGQKKSSEVKLANMVDSASYGIGLSIGKSLEKDGLKDLNLDAMMKAMRSALSKDTSMLLNEQQANIVIQAYVADIRKKKGEEALTKEKAFFDENAKKPGVITLPSGLQYTIIKAGTGPKPALNDTVNVHYHGTFLNGEVFDSSVDRGQPATFPLTMVIAAWTEALQLMPVGSKWKLYAPSKLAYGEQGYMGKIDPNTSLIFEVELLSIQGK